MGKTRKVSWSWFNFYKEVQHGLEAYDRAADSLQQAG